MKVRLIALPKGHNGKAYQMAPFYMSPKQDPNTKKFLTGQDIPWIMDSQGKIYSPESEENKKKRNEVALVIDPNESYAIRHLQEFDTENPIDNVMLEFIKKQDDIVALNKRSAIPTTHRFYIEDKEDEAVEIISTAKIELKALNAITEMNFAQMKELARVLGAGNVSNLTQSQVEAVLITKAKGDPKKFMAAVQDPEKSHRAFLKRCIENHLIKIVAGKYMRGEEIIGLSEKAALDYLRAPENRNISVELLRMMDDKKEPVTA